MKKTVLILLFAVMLIGDWQENALANYDPNISKCRWSEDRAKQWYKDVGVIRGCNYLPRTATNTTEIWQKESFAPEIIDQEFGWAAKAGYNSARVFVQYLVWKEDTGALKQRMDQFMSIAYKHGISIMWVLFDDCAFGYPPTIEPYLGKQGDPLPGEYSPYWTPSPGHNTAVDRKKWPDLEKYVKDIIGTFKDDKRVLIWDIYNEPGMSGMKDKSQPFLEASFGWARQINPTQPLTVGAYKNTDFQDKQSQRFFELSDIITFHSYNDVYTMEDKIRVCKRTKRPVICTEFMVRRNTNDFFACLPIFSEHKIGWYQWGLVAGRTQTYYHWGSKAGDPLPKTWQCDVFYSSGLPYDPEEMELIRKFGFYDEIKTLLPTSEKQPQQWNYIMEPPAFGWHMAGDFNYKVPYQGVSWKQGPGAFGTKDTPLGVIKTIWNSNNIWMRKSFNLKEKPSNPYLRIRHDEEFYVFVNGQLAAKRTGYNTFYEYIPFNPLARDALKEGKNIISIHCHKPKDSRGGQYIDIGVVDIVVPEVSAYYVKYKQQPEVKIDTGNPWTVEKAWQWYRSIPATKGANFLPSSAVNSVEMWQKETFDPETIDRELGYAAKAGYNSMRVFLQYLVWEDDPEGFLNRFDKYLEISAKHGITTMPIFFDDCCFAMKMEPLLGTQDDPLIGAINSGWVPSPGYSMVVDRSQWPKLETFVKSVVTRFKNDKRVLVWDVYNEPGPGFSANNTSYPLVKATFGWIRQINPVQPVSVCSFANPRSMELHQYSDVITHHDYGSAGLETFFKTIYEKHKRPAFITECMFHEGGGSFKNILPIYAKYNAGWYNWGLVAGKSQCYYYFGSAIGTTIPEKWLCEIFWLDGTPYDPEEIKMIKNFEFKEFTPEIKKMLSID